MSEKKIKLLQDVADRAKGRSENIEQTGDQSLAQMHGLLTGEKWGKKIWEANFAILEKYSRNNGGDANIQCRDSDNRILYRWAVRQRYRKGSLTSGQIERLKSIGLDFDWCSRKNMYDKNWNAMYDNLVDYHKQHGNCDVPRSYKSERHGQLGYWVTNMRAADAGRKKKCPKLTDENKEKVRYVYYQQVTFSLH